MGHWAFAIRRLAEAMAGLESCPAERHRDQSERRWVVDRSDGSVLVVGGGVFGLTAAIELRRRGRTVSLIDPGPLPHPLASSTDISKMIRMDYGSDQLYLTMMEEAFVGWRAWNDEWGKPLYHETGFLILAGEPLRPGGFEHDSYVALQARGHPVERLDSTEIRKRFPDWVAERYPDGYFNPVGGYAESGYVVARLVAEARRLGVAVDEGVGFRMLMMRGSRVIGVVTTDGDERRADIILVAGGAWTPALLHQLDDVIHAVAQPVLHFGVDDPERYRPPRFPPWAADIARTGWYGFPAMPNGTLKIANHGPGQPVHPDDPRSVAPDAEDHFRRFLRSALPSLAEAPLIGSRVCLYCDTWDGNFWIDHDPERPGLVVATGGSGHAFKFAPILGGLIADVVERAPNPYASRFAWRSPAERHTEDARFVG
jgi:glycine/D-amino acid oxidase-like deaminating enzyme